jgi:hypothetical protein
MRATGIRAAAGTLAAGFALALLAGCGGGHSAAAPTASLPSLSNQQVASAAVTQPYAARGAVPPGPATRVRPATPPAAPPVAAPVPPEPSPPVAATPGQAAAPGKPLTQWQKQFRDECNAGIVQDGCQFYTDQSLQLQGYNPES